MNARASTIALAGLLLLALGALWRTVGAGPLPPAGRAATGPTEGGASTVPLSAGDTAGAVDERVALARWEVSVADPTGRPLTRAAITARAVAQSGATALEATGRAEWIGLQPGTYALVVEAAGFPRWTADVELAAGAHERTLVRLGEACRVAGRVRDTRGAALKDHMVAFLAPAQRMPETAPELLGLPHATTARDGTFELSLPRVGDWRLVVVHGGRLVHEEPRAKSLAADRTERAEVVVQATTRLTLRLDAEPLAPGNEALTIYALASPLELARREELRRHMAELAALGSSEPEPDEPEALEELRRAQNGESDPLLLAQLERQRRWATVVPEGWVKVQSTVIPEPLVVVFDRLPHDTELRLALRRGDEVLRVAPAVFLGHGADQSARLVPPERLAAGADAPVELRTAALVLEPAALGRAPLPGVTWQ